MKGNLFEDSDLADILAELEKVQDKTEENEDKEIQAAKRRYEEITKKHKNETM